MMTFRSGTRSFRINICSTDGRHQNSSGGRSHAFHIPASCSASHSHRARRNSASVYLPRTISANTSAILSRIWFQPSI